MLGTSVVLCVLLGQAPQVDPSELVARLGAPRYAAREEATSALQRLGRRALPALQAARNLRDPEVRARAASLIVKIEGTLLTQPTMVALDFENARLSEVIASLAEQTGVKFALVPEQSPAWATRRVTVHEPEPLPFWKAMDRVCQAARLQYNFGMHTTSNGREQTFPLFDGTVRPSLPVSDSGPFRVSIVGLHFQRDVTFPPAPQLVPAPGGGGVGPAARPSAMVNEQFYAQVHVAGEPRLALAQTGALRITEAVDDAGNVLAGPPPGFGGLSRRESGYFGFATGSVLQLQAPMNRPAHPGSSIQRLKGVLPVTVSTRKPDPLVAPLAGVPARTVQNAEVALTVHEFKPQGENRPPTIDLTVKRLGGEGNGSAAFAGGELAAVRPDSFQQQVEVCDAQARPIPWYQTGFDAEAGRMTLTLTAANPTAVAVEVRFYGLVRAATEVPFSFENVPLP